MVSELALALVLLVGTGLLVESFWHLVGADLGFTPANLLTMKLALPEDSYSPGAQVQTFAEQILDRIRTLPGVRRAAIASPLPLSGMNVRAQYAVEGNAVGAGGQQPEADYAAVSDDYFQTMGIPVLQGHSFTDSDAAKSPAVLIVNSVIAKQLWPGENPIRQTVDGLLPGGRGIAEDRRRCWTSQI